MATAPQRMGRYRIERPLGSGAFATVWLAFDEEFQTPVAIKALADNWSRDADVHERFLSEARILRRINSHRVVRVHDIGSHEGGPYFVMDYIPGGTVADLPRGSDLPASAALRWGAEASYALEDLHRAGVLHRDAKPANLLIDSSSPTPMIKVTDLGTAKALADSSGLTVTTGTPAYMAPEQVHGAAGSDQRADVYALAVVTYELLCGERPFQVDGVTSVLARRPEDRPPPLAGRCQLPSELDELMVSALSLDPNSRPSSAKEFGDRLVAFADRIDQDSGRMRATLAPSPIIRLPRTPPTQSMPAPVDPSQFRTPPRTVGRPAAEESRPRSGSTRIGAQQAPGLDQTYVHQVYGLPPYGVEPDQQPDQVNPGAARPDAVQPEPVWPDSGAGQEAPVHRPADAFVAADLGRGRSADSAGEVARREGPRSSRSEAPDPSGQVEETTGGEVEGSSPGSNWPTVLVVLAGVALFLMVSAVVWLLLS